MSMVKFEKIKRPEKIGLPFMLDFYPLQDEKNTRISQFFKSLKEGHLTTTKCKECGKVLWPPRIMCPECLSESLEWVDLGVEGELYAFTEIRLGAPLGFVEDVPFCVGIVKIGSLLISARIDDAKYEDLKIGDKVNLKIVELPDSRVFYRFSKDKEQ
ncbi:Zn-ribbon domain-containing OB-fold protein [Candidatus Bathyarchaeota archaeon]|nr:MAG: Zn-ribbon domain-containing OB-fold protein [Candidatus Bathyarchaeota archaeon]